MYANDATVRDISETLGCTESDVLILMVSENMLRTLS